MGKYTRKRKTTPDVAVMEVSFGVRTRSKTIALQQHSSSYLQLRSRRLQKPSPLSGNPQNHLSRTQPIHVKEDCVSQHEQRNGKMGVIQRSFGDNCLEFEGTERGARESTPCILIGDSETIRTPDSTTRTAGAGDNIARIPSSLRRHVPTPVEIDEFFARAEEELQKQFIKKYNFDPVNDKPLPGRYEWERMDP